MAKLPRLHPARLAATQVLRRAARAWRTTLPRRVTEIRPLDAPEFVFTPVDSMVMDAVFWFGVRGYEGIVAATWIEQCRNARSILEIGGNVGLFTVIGAAAAPAVAYTVVEPVPAIAATLRRNLALNRLDHVEVLEAAVVPGEQERDVVLNLPQEGRAMPVGAHVTASVEVTGRSTQGLLTARGLPVRHLAAGRDLIKIDAEGIEAALLEDLRDQLLRDRPTLLVEVLPEARRLGALLAELATTAGYIIQVLPEYGSDRIVSVAPRDFTSEVPRRYNSKDVILSVAPISKS